ncbi:MAG TPA: ABC transporter ATP-binding protein [Mycobacteriales bacterium]|jgi:branched-chain amino acid transport system ATP-binding protein|nr:ABC transporter ATP-binding protein [Mycobacteriales bacterium]
MTALLELSGLTKRFGLVTVAGGIDLSVGDGEALGIVGPNGAGKTTLFSMISGDLAPDAGEVRFDGAAVTRKDAAARCRLGMGRTYQVPRPFEDMTVFENVLVAARYGAGLSTRDGYALAASVLAETGLAAQANQRAGTLTLLQRKRLEVARALGTRPRLLLLDEVAGGLTDPEVEELVAIVHGLKARGLAIVWIEHVVRALTSTVDRLVCLAAGDIIGDGDPADVLASPAVREVYLGADPAPSAVTGPDLRG